MIHCSRLSGRCVYKESGSVYITGLEFDGGTAAICRRADWPQCLVNETVVFGQIGRALFHLQVTSN